MLVFIMSASVDSIATRYWLYSSAIESQRGQDFLHMSRLALRPTQPPIQWVPGLSQELSGQGAALTTHPYIVQRLKRE